MTVIENQQVLWFFRRGVEDPDYVTVSEKEAKEVVQYYFDSRNAHTRLWKSSDGRFVIDLSTVDVVRSTDVDESQFQEDDDDEDDEDDDWSPLKKGYGPKD